MSRPNPTHTDRPPAAPLSQRQLTAGGFALVDTVAAAGILVIGVVGLTASLGLGIQLNNASAGHERARSLVQQTLEEVRAADWDVAAARFASHTSSFATALGEEGTIRVSLLNELEASEAFGEPLDLDRDGQFDEQESPHAGMRFHAVLVSATWPEAGHWRTIEQQVLLFPLEN